MTPAARALLRSFLVDGGWVAVPERDIAAARELARLGLVEGRVCDETGAKEARITDAGMVEAFRITSKGAR